jgi:hypothetical protein
MESRKARKYTKGAAPFIGIGRPVPAADLKIRLEERDRRLAADTRTEAEKWLGDPPVDRSVLAAKR